METPELPPSFPRPAAAPVAAPASDLQSQVDSLRALLNVVLLILLLMALVAVYLLNRKVGGVRQQVEANQAQVEKLSTEYETILKPRINQFLQVLLRYSQTDPNFANVLRKYPIQMAQPAGAPAPAAAPAPAPK